MNIKKRVPQTPEVLEFPEFVETLSSSQPDALICFRRKAVLCDAEWLKNSAPLFFEFL